jgi:hypothetical protein
MTQQGGVLVVGHGSLVAVADDGAGRWLREGESYVIERRDWMDLVELELELARLPGEAGLLGLLPP